MTDQELRAVVLSVLGEVAPDADLASLALDDDLRQRLDIDSMDHLNFVIGLHEATGVEIPERDYARLVTLRDTIAYLSSRPRSARAKG
ncbi:MAG: acyl carrier protein [Deltaproteobacteria bacterium]|nr:acyl carrier protein [Deltaproteobacteria bacterium]